MNTPLLFIRIFLLALFTVPAAVLVLSIQRVPAVASADNLSPAQLAEIQQLLIDNDPRLFLDEENKTIVLDEDEVNALLTYLITEVRGLSGVSGSAALGQGTADLHLTRKIPATLFGGYINLRISLRERNGLPVIQAVHAGALEIPSAMASPLFLHGWRLMESRGNLDFFNSLARTVETIRFAANRMELHLDWRDSDITTIHNHAREAFLDGPGREKLLSYYEIIETITAGFPESGSVSLNELLTPLFSHAYDNALQGGDPIAENRAAFLAATVYITDLRLDHLLGTGRNHALPSPQKRRMLVMGRRDLAQHIIASAAIAASAGTRAAEIISIYKEVHDARYTTGFSFSDITANRTGTALGALGTQDHESALALQEALSSMSDESDYMPSIEPDDGLSEEEFNRLYGDRATERYRLRLEEIDASIAGRPLFRKLGMPW